jgi:ATP-dependent protease Clp ATPase subunit
MEVAFLNDGLRAVAELAIKENTGARGLMTVLESSLRPFKFYLPGSPVKRFAVTRKLVQDPHSVLNALQEDPGYGMHLFMETQIREFENRFFQEHGISITFNDAAVKTVLNVAQERGERVPDYLDEVLMDYVYGLRIIKEHTGQTDFELSAENIEKPRDVLDRWVKEALKED